MQWLGRWEIENNVSAHFDLWRLVESVRFVGSKRVAQKQHRIFFGRAPRPGQHCRTSI